MELIKKRWNYNFMEMKTSDFTISEILTLRQNNMIYINPEYQRGAVWNQSQEKKLIDSIFRSYPLPFIYLHHIRKQVAEFQQNNLEIIDSQQRINLLYEFKEGTFSFENGKAVRRICHQQMNN